MTQFRYTRTDEDGRIWGHHPDLGNCARTVAVWWEAHGELVKWPYVLHHKDWNPGNDDLLNVEKITHAQHMTIHQTGAKRPPSCGEVISAKAKARWANPEFRAKALKQLASARSISQEVVFGIRPQRKIDDKG